MVRFGGAVVIVSALVGCAALAPKQEDPATLALACELSACACRATAKDFWAREADAKPVQYRRDGTAFCPEGYRLERGAAD
jgi:hypothetical protein